MARRTGFIKRTAAAAFVPTLILAAFSLLARPLAAQVPPDADWATIETEHFRVTFPRALEALGRRAGARAERAYAELSEAFIDPPGGRIDLVITDHQDVSNGYAQIRPSNRITVFARPPADDLGLGYFDDWMELVVTHELAHVFHLDRAGPLGRALRSVFGRVRAPWPFFPNTSLPRWTTEGLATWYESSLSDAGRVHGSYHEMLVRTAALEGEFPGLGEVSGDSPIWPGGTRAYAFGSLFFEHLLDAYGEERMGAFAEAVAGQWVPYRLDSAAKDAFGHTLSEEWSAWREDIERTNEELRRTRAGRPSPPQPERLTRDGRIALYPKVSPDGEALVYARADGRSEVQLHTAALDGSGGRMLLRTNAVATYDFGPDGAILLSQLELQDPYRAYDDLYLRAADGSVTRLTEGARLTQPSVAPGGRWAVVVRDTLGSNELVRFDLSTRAQRTLATADADVHWAFPSVSPDGRWIAVTRWTPGAFLDVVVLDAATGALAVRVTDDRALDMAPTWSPDGRWLLWTSDRSGVPNLLAAEVDPAAGRASAPRAVTDVLTGAAFASVDPEGRWVYFSGYHATGWDVERTAWAPESWPAAAPAADRFRAAPRAAELQAARIDGDVKGYSPLATLRPTFWEPLLREPVHVGTIRSGDAVVPGRDLTGPAVGIQTSGYDVVGRHAFDAFARVFTSTNAGKFDGGVSYSYMGLGNPVLSIGASQFWDDDGARLARPEEGAPLDTLFVLERDRNVSAGLTLLHQRWRRALSLTLSGGLSWEHRQLLDNFLEPTTAYRLSRPEARFADTRVTLSYSTAHAYGYQVGASAGTSFFVRGRMKRELGLTDSLTAQAGWDGSLDEVIGQLRTFQALDGPGYASHVFALRVSGGAARGPGADAGHFEVGGAAGSRETVTGLSLFGGSSLFFPLRGYPQAMRYGSRAWSASAEYRVPLGVVNAGLGPWPLSVDRILGSVFFDAGNAWGPEIGIQGYQNPRRSSLASAGAEVMTGFLAFWSVPLDLRLGAALPLVDADGAVFYVRLGLSF